MSFAVKPIADHVGVEVIGLDVRNQIDEADKAELRRLWRDKGVLLFREAITSPEIHLQLNSVFGSSIPHPVEGLRLASQPELMVLVSDPEDRHGSTQPVEEVDGTLVANFTPWHKDLIYTAKINHGGLLRAVETPDTGGETGFIDQAAAYEAMSPALKERVEGLSVVYQLSSDKSQERFIGVKSVRAVGTTAIRENGRKNLSKFPQSVHPLVYRQQETGRPILNFSPWFARYVVGMEAAASDDLLFELTDLCCRPHLAYHHRWKPNDAILFDNWRVLHAAGSLSLDQRRIVHRTTIPGDYGHGRLLH
jgi:taurine dioxygenase